MTRTREESMTLRHVVAHLRRQAGIAARVGDTKRAGRRNRWADALAGLSRKLSGPKGCKGCYYEGEEVNRCMCCDRMEWRVDKWTKEEAK